MKLGHCSILLALGTLCQAWRADFSDAVQCETVTVNWAGSAGEHIGPPFVVRMAAFGLAPLTITMPTSAWNNLTRVGSFSFSMPWPEGTKFITAMDDGFGSGTGGITGIQTVKSSSNSSCIDAGVMQPKHVFDVHGSFAQCSIVSMNWTEPASSQTLIAGLVPNGVSFQLDPPLTSSRSTTWALNIPAGTAFVLIYSDPSGSGLTSPLLLSTGDGSNTQCLTSGAHPSATASQTGISQVTPAASSVQIFTPSATPGSENTRNGGNSRNLGPILGATLGSLALLSALGFAFCVVMRRRRRQHVLPQSPELAKKMNLDTENTQLGRHLDGHNLRSSPYQPNGAIILPFILPPNASSQQAGTPSPARREKHPAARSPSSDALSISDSSHAYGTGTSASQSNAPPIPGLRGDVDDDEPVIFRHEDGGAMPLPRIREVIELPPGYDQLPPRAPSQAPSQALPQAAPQAPQQDRHESRPQRKARLSS